MTERDLARFDAFVREARPALLRVARNLCRTASVVDPEDLVEETLERAFRKLGRNNMATDPLSLSYITTVMTNRFIDLCRRKRVEEGAVRESVEKEEPMTPEVEHVERWRGASDDELRAGIASLHPPRIRMVYELHARGLRYRQIAEKVGIPEGTVGSDLTEARRQLRKFLKGGGR